MQHTWSPFQNNLFQYPLQGLVVLIVACLTRVILAGYFGWILRLHFSLLARPFVNRVRCTVRRPALRPDPWWRLMCLRWRTGPVEVFTRSGSQAVCGVCP